MSVKATITVSTSPAATSRCSSVHDNVGEVTTVSQPGRAALPATGAHDDLGGQLRGRFLRAATSEVHHTVFRVNETLTVAGHGPCGRGADQDGGADLHRRTVVVAYHAVEVGHPWMSAVDNHQTDKPAQPGRRQLPGELAPGAVADHYRPIDPQHVEDADHRLCGQPRVDADNDGPKRSRMQALTRRVVGGRRTFLVAQNDNDDALVRTSYAHRDRKPVERGHH